jgi:hypothetical protein
MFLCIDKEIQQQISELVEKSFTFAKKVNGY